MACGRPVRQAHLILPNARDALEVLSATIFLYLTQSAEEGRRANGKSLVPVADIAERDSSVAPRIRLQNCGR